MPIYHFHLADGERQPDNAGIELPDIAAARLAAVQFAGELLRYEPAQLWQKGQWRVEVTDKDNVLLCTIVTLAIDAPSPHRQGGTGALDDPKA